jgi:uncharacterized protein (TIGR02284 family)
MAILFIFWRNHVENNDLTVSVLNDLIRTSKDAEQCFAYSTRHVQDPQLKAFFIHRTREAAKDVTELQDLVVSLGGIPIDSPSIGHLWHRYWIDLKTAIDLAVLNEVERGEDFTLKVYRKAAEQSLPPAVRTVVLRQFDHAHHNYDEIKGLRDSAQALAN